MIIECLKPVNQRHELTIKGFAKYGLTEVIFGICNSIVLWFGAGLLWKNQTNFYLFSGGYLAVIHICLLIIHHGHYS